MNKIIYRDRVVAFLKNRNFHAVCILSFFLVIFYRDIVFYNRTFLMETAVSGTMPFPNPGPYGYQGVKPGFVATDVGAIAFYNEPLNRFVSESVKSGNFPLWNPYMGLAGSPILADGQTAPLEPIQFLFFLAPERYWPYAVDLQLLLRFFIAGFSCYLFAQRQKIDFVGSISAGVLFMFSSYFVAYGNHPQIKTEALLPLVLYGYDRLSDSEDRYAFWISALLIGWAVIAGMPEATFFVLFLGTLWYFYKSVFQKLEKGNILNRIKFILFRYFGATLLGLLISSAYLLPFLEFLSLAKSVHNPEIRKSPYILWDLPNTVLFHTELRQLTLGFFAIFALTFCILHIKDWTKHRLVIIFCSLYTITFTLTIFDFPLTNWIYLLPVFNQISFIKYPLPSIVFCLAILTGIFVDRARHFSLSNEKLLWSALIIGTVFSSILIWGNPSNLPSPFVLDIKLYKILFALIAGILFSLFSLGYLYRHKKISPRILQISLLLLVFLEPFYWSTRIDRPDRFDPYQTPPFVAYLRKDKEPFRIFGFNGILFPNTSTAYGLTDIRWLNALIPQRTYDFSKQFIESNEVISLRFTGVAMPIFDKMFDLLNVKYILRKKPPSNPENSCYKSANNQIFSTKDTIDQLILEQNPDKKSTLIETPLRIDSATRTAIQAQAPNEFSVKLNPDQTSSILNFSIGLNPKVFLPKYGDGVTFKITLLEGSNKIELYSKYIDPKNNPCDRKWFDENIDLSRWSGKNIILNFSTDPGPVGNIGWDLAYWGNIGLSDSNSSLHYRQIYDNQGILIYQNDNVLPRAFMVHNVVNVLNQNNAFAKLKNPNIDLKQTAIIENLPVDLVNTINQNDHLEADKGNAKLISSGELDVAITTKASGLLVVSDQYYPGWEATVDGKQTPIYAVDGMLKGVFLDSGTHKIKFEYKPLSFLIGIIITTLSLAFTLTIFLWEYRNSR